MSITSYNDFSLAEARDERKFDYDLRKITNLIINYYSFWKNLFRDSSDDQ